MNDVSEAPPFRTFACTTLSMKHFSLPWHFGLAQCVLVVHSTSAPARVSRKSVDSRSGHIVRRAEYDDDVAARSDNVGEPMCLDQQEAR